MRLIVLAAAALALSPPPADDVTHALNRLAFGARPSDVAGVQQIGLSTWIARQLAPERLPDTALEARLAAVLERASAAATMPLTAAPGSDEARVERRRRGREMLATLTEERILRAVYSERQLQEVLVDFWFNHFNVFARKGQTELYIAEYEREAIRPHVLGRFRDLLGATAKSPAMLFYLDNWMSVSGDAPRGPQQRARGLNENYARELLELHTLGVDGGYTQQDVVDVARAFTGWTIDRNGVFGMQAAGAVRPRRRRIDDNASGPDGFRFAAAMHDRGEKRVLGHTLAAGGGLSDGEKVLDIVAAHPSTARHIARKLATRFISDTPPQAVIDRAAARFRETNGNLREVVRSIVTSPEFMAPAARAAKIKTPFEYVISALRAVDAQVSSTDALARALQGMGMPLFLCVPPTGYGETADAWVSSGSLVNRINFAVALSDGRLRGVTVPAAARQSASLAVGSAEFQRQ